MDFRILYYRHYFTSYVTYYVFDTEYYRCAVLSFINRLILQPICEVDFRRKLHEGYFFILKIVDI